MGVGSLLACGPAGWAVLGIAAVGGAATGAATVAAARKKIHGIIVNLGVAVNKFVYSNS